MNEAFIDMGLAFLLALLQREIPTDGSKKSKWRKALLKLFKAIGNAYHGDPEFKI